MKNRFLTVVFAAAVVLVFSGFLILQQGEAQTPEQEQLFNLVLQRSVTVTAVGQVQVEPDQAVVRLGVETEAETASQALQQNNQQMNNLIFSLGEAGIASQDIQTQAIRLFPRYEEQATPRAEPGQSIVAYRAVNVVEVTVRDLPDLGEVLDSAVEAGGNIVEGIHFEVSDQSDLLDQARAAAMAEAQRKAELLAAAAGARLDQVLSIEETSRAPSPVRAPVLEMAADAAVPVEPGAETIEVTVEVSWLLQ
jgi:uncharacterized protein